MSETPEGEPTPAERVRTFFDDVLPRVIASRADVFDRAEGTVCVMVQGAGAWTLRFGDHAAAGALKAEASLEADLVATWAPDAFTRLLDADDSEPETLRPVYLGDARLLEKLGALLVPPARGGLGARMMFGG